ncbi:MAG: glycosyltransferase, partial [Bifidobacteriaceae bacterium]|nr:glycosyltransferase [Bifidobacteriaceae bacterium]
MSRQSSTPGRDQFSVLMPVYHRDIPRQVRAAFESVTTYQTLAPAQIVIVRDGPVGLGLAELLGELAGQPQVDVVELGQNLGLAAALNAGLEACRFPVVARQDADDLSFPNRFELTVPLVKGPVQVVGGAMREFTEVPAGTACQPAAADPQPQTLPAPRPGTHRCWGPERTYPLTTAEIVRQAKLRNPMAHPTVVFNKNAVQRCGGYRPFHHLEDYDLWVRLLQAGAEAANVPDVVVAYCAPTEAYGRRGGLKTLRAEWELQRELLRTGFVSPAQRLRN